MRRDHLPPPRSLTPEGIAPAPDGPPAVRTLRESPSAERTPPDTPPAHRTLRAPHPATARRRPLFHPRTGWFRRLERSLNHLLSTRLYPYLPGLDRLYGWQLERGLTVSEGEIPVRDLPAEFDGLSILLVTDLHTGPFLPRAALRRVFDRLLGLRPELILLGGDLASARAEEIDANREAFVALSAARPPLGVFAVLGNHDHYTGDPHGVRRRLEATGVAVLHNRSVVLRRGAGHVVLAGIDDLHAGEPDLQRALAGEHPPGAPVVLLSHNPDVFFEAARRGVALVLSGHTHGGQMRLPGLPVLVRMSRYRLDEGRYETGGAQLVVSRGLGVTGLPFRFACPPEAVLLRLRRPR
jgi:uncharacterized protein